MTQEYRAIEIGLISVLLLIALTLFSACGDNSREDHDDDIQPFVDDGDYWRVRFGDGEARVPKERWDGEPAGKRYDMIPSSLCVDPNLELEECTGFDESVQIFLKLARTDLTVRKCNVDEDFTNAVYRGPFDSAHPKVDLYRDDSGRSRMYVLRREFEPCRYPRASCNATNCSSFGSLRPGFSFNYNFPNSALPTWPEIHERVIAHSNTILVED